MYSGITTAVTLRTTSAMGFYTGSCCCCTGCFHPNSRQAYVFLFKNHCRVNLFCHLSVSCVPCREVTTQNKIRRTPTKPAIVVGTFCFLLSIAIIVGVCMFVFPYAKQNLHAYVFYILLAVGTLPLCMTILWLTLFLMICIEKIFGVSFRTKSGLGKDG